MRRMLLAASAVLTVACISIPWPSSPATPLDTTFELRAGSHVMVAGGLIIKFERVSSDSRCPMDALCVRQGEATVVLRLEASRRAVSRELQTPPAASETAYSGYTIRLTGLQPYPAGSQPIPQNQYVATLVVTK
jgi:hypothetical protein